MKATLWRALGALVGAGAGVPAGIGLKAALGAGIAGLLGGIGLAVAGALVLYLIANAFRSAGTASAEFMVGLLLGVNTAINVVLIQAVLGTPFTLVCVVPALAIVQPLAQTDAYQFPLGWSNWLLPMSWPIVALGLLLFLPSLLLGWIPGFFRLKGFKLDWRTGTFVLAGGIGGNANANADSDGYNLGNFAFLRSAASPYLVAHESGHTLNLAAWGCVVHLIGAIDENVIGRGAGAYTEWMAEGNVPGTLRMGRIFPLWGQ